MKHEVCNHDLNDPDTSLILSNFQTMVYPRRYYTVCARCCDFFEFEKDKDGHYVGVSKEVAEYGDIQ